MIRFTRGNLLDAKVDAVVNTVNEVGVMGKGIALMFRDAFPENTHLYERAAKRNEIRVGTMFVTENPEVGGPRWIVNFPTKKHWRQPSRLQWVHDGLQDFVRVIHELGIKSVALPPLGCGNGGLAWADVRVEIVRALDPLTDVEVVVYEPTSAYQGKAKESGVEKLTPARALIAEIVRRYASLGLECTILEVQKLAWFLSRELSKTSVADPLQLKFTANNYGPYDDRLRHLLNALDGSYLHAGKRLADAGPLDLIWFDNAHREVLSQYLRSRDFQAYLPALERTAVLIDGFESPLGMELLATVDWLVRHERVEPTIGAIRVGLEHWPSGAAAAKRKVALFDDRLLHLALDRLATPPAPSANHSPASLFD